MSLLLAVERRGKGDPRRFPFSVDAIRTLERLDLGAPVTFFVGENGSGKSTLLEAIAIACGLPSVGSADATDDGTLDAQRSLACDLKLSKGAWTHRGFFLRAEDFFGYTKRLARERAELERRIVELEEEYRAGDRSDWALGLAQGPMRASLADMTRRYGADLDANSHGQSFLRLFEARFVPRGLHLLDEPEAALSPRSQMALLAMMVDTSAEGAQFVIATHSPILLAFPGARIYSFDEPPVREVAYEELEHVRLTKEFLAAPERYLRHLRAGAAGDE